MKVKLFFKAALVALALTVFSVTPALAASSPIYASGTITGITPGVVKPAGNSGNYVVKDRQISGVITGDISGEFILEYHALIELATQSGNLQGTLSVGEYDLTVNGKIAPLELVPTPYGYLPKLTISGHWSSKASSAGSGSYDAWVIFVPTPEGHVGYIIASSFTMTGN